MTYWAPCAHVHPVVVDVDYYPSDDSDDVTIVFPSFVSERDKMVLLSWIDLPGGRYQLVVHVDNADDGIQCNECAEFTSPIAAIFCALRGIAGTTCGTTLDASESNQPVLLQRSDAERLWAESVLHRHRPQDATSVPFVSMEHFQPHMRPTVSCAEDLLHYGPDVGGRPVVVETFSDLFFAGLVTNALYSHLGYRYVPVKSLEQKVCSRSQVQFPIVFNAPNPGVTLVQVTANVRYTNPPQIKLPPVSNPEDIESNIHSAVDVAFPTPVCNEVSIGLQFYQMGRPATQIKGASWTAALAVALLGVSTRPNVMITGEINRCGYYATSNPLLDNMRTAVLYAVGDTAEKLVGATRRGVTTYLSNLYPAQIAESMYLKARHIGDWVSGDSYAMSDPSINTGEVICITTMLELYCILWLRGDACWVE